MRRLILVAHNVRSTHNVGSLLRTAEGLGVEMVFLTGYTPYPRHHSDSRLPHLATKIDAQIHKTALGAEKWLVWRYAEDIAAVISQLQDKGFTIIALEQTATAIPLNQLPAPQNIALIIGNEVAGIEPEVLAMCEVTTVIPMFGKKESFNVVQAAAMALYHCRFA